MTKTQDILYIDDAPNELLTPARAVGADERFADFQPAEPAATRAAAKANLWVFDFFNDDKQRTDPDLDGVKTNGLSVFQQFRLLVGDARPPAVLVSNHLPDALGVEVLQAKRHVLAEQVGVEWIAPKVGTESDSIREIVSLADGTARLHKLGARLRESQPAAYSTDLARLALKLPQRARWSASAVRNVAEWRPPVWVAPQTVSKPGAPTVRPDIRLARDVIAWMVRHVLPYPSFLVRERHIAVRLRLTLACLRQALATETELSKLLGKVHYNGILHDFAGSRWWTAGIDDIDWDLPRSGSERTAVLGRLVHPVQLVELDLDDPVVVSDSDLIETDEVAAIAECVRAADEYFPPQASPAWVRIEAAREDKSLARKVRLEDQADLEPEPQAGAGES
ncbi:hypothetical protein J2W24_002382 [Variovorax boronicumulans]|uniref:hypothetical protein n=1 Tax=Variovorax boronicumulans TaxID=436515 RepID=UPI002781C9E1|nr:hypothetical protein [Variovorax boronicumulans]MDP9916735.1 hypothetical protein [Variovorax boronicumulans]